MCTTKLRIQDGNFARFLHTPAALTLQPSRVNISSRDVKVVAEAAGAKGPRRPGARESNGARCEKKKISGRNESGNRLLSLQAPT